MPLLLFSLWLLLLSLWLFIRSCLAFEIDLTGGMRTQCMHESKNT